MSRARAGRPRHSGLTALGPDRAAIRVEQREDSLYDLGLGKQAADFCIRTADTGLIRRLNEHVGRGWNDLLANLGGAILQASPTRVVQSAIGRVELYTRIPLPGGRSPTGPHTQFLPAHLAGGRETPPGLELPESLIPCAVFYPGREVDSGPC